MAKTTNEQTRPKWLILLTDIIMNNKIWQSVKPDTLLVAVSGIFSDSPYKPKTIQKIEKLIHETQDIDQLHTKLCELDTWSSNYGEETPDERRLICELQSDFQFLHLELFICKYEIKTSIAIDLQRYKHLMDNQNRTAGIITPVFFKTETISFFLIKIAMMQFFPKDLVNQIVLHACCLNFSEKQYEILVQSPKQLDLLNLLIKNTSFCKGFINNSSPCSKGEYIVKNLKTMLNNRHKMPDYVLLDNIKAHRMWGNDLIACPLAFDLHNAIKGYSLQEFINMNSELMHSKSPSNTPCISQ